MGILDSLTSVFNKEGENKSTFGWNELESKGEVEEVISASAYRPQVILKHSTRCGTSFFAKQEVESVKEEKRQDMDFHIVDVIHQRSVSQYIADKLEVRHESPQLFIIRNGEVSWHGSHGSVRAEKLRKAV